MFLLSVSVMARRFAQHDLFVYLPNVYRVNIYCVNVYNGQLTASVYLPGAVPHGHCLADKRIDKAKRWRFFGNGSQRAA